MSSGSESEYELDYKSGSESAELTPSGGESDHSVASGSDNEVEMKVSSPITIPTKQKGGSKVIKKELPEIGKANPFGELSQDEIQKKKDKRAETSRLNLAKARARKLELAQLRKIEKAKDVITSHIVHEQETDSDETSDDSSDEEEVILPKRKSKRQDALVKQVTKLTKAKEKKRKKAKDDDDRIKRLEQLLADQLATAKKTAKKAVRKPKTKTTIVQIEQPKTNDNLKNFAKAALLDLGL